MKDFNFKAAISNLNKVLKEDSNNPAALYARGKCYISLQSYKEAIPDLLSLIQDFPLYEKNAYIALAMSFVAVDDYQTAVRQLTQNLKTRIWLEVNY
jgi:tetratricopeptide (TPR) repeat protein